MDPSVIRHNISGLESAMHSLESWLTFWTALVVLGLVLEYGHEIPEAIADLKQSWSWKPFCVIAGGILISVGVAGELCVQFLASRKETALRSANASLQILSDAEVKSAITSAGDAKTSAQGAHDAATLAQDSAKLANAEAGKAQDQARKAQNIARDVAGQATRLAENLASLQQPSFPRHLRQDEFAKNLKPRQEFPVSVETIPDFEAQRTAAAIASGVSMAKWTVLRNV